jgi:hypothetical protein
MMVVASRIALTIIFLLCGWATSVSAQIAGGVSPGLADRIVDTGARCPTFSWQEVPEAAGYELVAYSVPEGIQPSAVTSADLVPETEVLWTRVPRGSTSWTPALDRCLTAGGSYVWFVRTMYEDESDEDHPGHWSEALYFRVSTRPSPEEVNEALRVLRRYVGQGATSTNTPAESADSSSRRGHEVASRFVVTSKSASTATATIRGSITDPTGEVYGVVGVVESPHGAGLAAANLRGGADLVLDGSSTGELDLLLDQRTLDRPSPSDQVFIMHNSGAGMLNLEVEGVISGIGEGITNVDAAALGGLPPHMWANKEGLITSGGVPVHWDNLADVPPDLADGDQDTTFTAGAGLMLDGSELSAVWPGTTWGQHISTTVDSEGDTGWAPSITIGSDGLGLISFQDYTNDDLKVAHCNDILCSSVTTNTIDSDGIVGSDSSITVGSDGLGIISYHDDTNDDLKVAHCDNVVCSSATTSTIDSDGIVGRDTSITVGPDGLALISYFDSTNHDLKVAHCDNVVCSSATTSTIDSPDLVGWDTSITVGSDRLGLISYQDWTNGNLKVAHCNDVPCTSATISTIDTTGHVGGYTSITVGADGLGLISYCRQDTGDLKVAHCNNVACSSASIFTIDSVGTSGLYTSITIGRDGRGLISYYRDDTGNLKVAHCSNITCSESSSTGVDSDGDVGASNSITVGADGLPLISYRDWSNDDLKVVHCSNEFCIPHMRYR